MTTSPVLQEKEQVYSLDYRYQVVTALCSMLRDNKCHQYCRKRGIKRSLFFRLQISSCHHLCSMLHDNKHQYCRKRGNKRSLFYRPQISSCHCTICVLCYITTNVTNTAGKGAMRGVYSLDYRDEAVKALSVFNAT